MSSSSFTVCMTTVVFVATLHVITAQHNPWIKLYLNDDCSGNHSTYEANTPEVINGFEEAKSLELQGVWQVFLQDVRLSDFNRTIYRQTTEAKTCMNKKNLSESFDIDQYKFKELKRHGTDNTTINALVLFSGKSLSQDGYLVTSKQELPREVVVSSAVVFGSNINYWKLYQNIFYEGCFVCITTQNLNLKQEEFDVQNDLSLIKTLAVQPDVNGECTNENIPQCKSGYSKAYRECFHPVFMILTFLVYIICF